jgi:hypothetical protein
MKSSLLIVALLLTSISAVAQGKVSFNNDSSHLFVLGSTLSQDAALGGGDATVGNFTGAILASPLPSGLTLQVTLYAGTTVSSLSLQTTIILDVNGVTTPGRMVSKGIIFADIPGGTPANFQIVLTDIGATLPATIDNSVPASSQVLGATYFGTSGAFTATPGTGISYPGLVSGGPAGSTWTPANLVINAALEPSPPFIYAQPSSGSYVVGTNLVLSVSVAGTNPISYQWRKDGTPLDAATNATLTFTNLALGDAGNYDILVTNYLGKATSDLAVVQVLPTNAPSVQVNDKLAVGTVYVGGSASISITGGFPGGFLFYTLDGSTPTAASSFYTGSFSMTNSGMIRAMSLSADFSQSSEALPVDVIILPAYALSTSVSGSGTISRNPSGSSYVSNSVVVLTASASANWAFDHWTEDLTGSSNPASITMNGPRSVQAMFVPTAFPLTLGTPGGGSATANGQAINPNTYYPTGTVVQLQATPNSGWTFLNWQGSITGTANPFGLVMDQTQNVHAVFGTVVMTNIGGNGTVVMSSTNPVPYGTILTNWAAPAPGNRFVTWSGAVSGTNNPATFAVTTATPTVGALFALTSVTGGQLKNPRKIGADFVCDLDGTALRSYQILYSTNLVDWSDLVIVTNITGTATFTNTIENARRYYRALLLP